MNIWLLMVVIGLITFFYRWVFIQGFGTQALPSNLARALRFVPAAVLSAIIFPEVLLRQGSLDLSPGNPRLIAGLLATLIAWRTKNIVLTIAVGMAALLLLQWLLP